MLVLVDPSVDHVQKDTREMDKHVMILTRYVNSGLSCFIV